MIGGLTRIRAGMWGWATVKQPPEVLPIMPSRISVFFSKKLKLICQPEQMLAVSTLDTSTYLWMKIEYQC